MLRSQTGRLRVIGFAEGLSYLYLLFIAMPLKYGADLPQFVSIGGMAHGVLFSVYMAAVFVAFFLQRWRFPLLALAVAAAFVPFLFLALDRKLKNADRP